MVWSWLMLLLFAATLHGQRNAEYATERNKMIEEAVIAAGVDDPRVVRALRLTPRHEFVALQYRSDAYEDMALPIGFQQTISSPFIVAFMTQCLDPQPADRVLEIGTGSGFQAAVLSPLVKEVYSIEIVPGLGRKAERTLRRLDYQNVHTKVGDGFQGWEEHAPFDKIIVTCSPEKVPVPLVEQLREGGLIVIPTGERYQQTLYLLRKTDGQLEAESLRPTLFVPMTGIAENNRRQLPDPANPQAINGGFEEPPRDNGFVPGWYYQRNLNWIEDSEAPEGSAFVSFENERPGRPTHVLQGFPIDGREVRELNLSAWVRYDELWFDRRSKEFPAIAITLYDENRKDLGHFWIGPFQGTSNWKKVSKRLRVPNQAREGILRIGLFGSKGTLMVDDVRLENSTNSPD
jgi:protein-L-isoaspartate(D-aspartate) O-methyltransferase